MLTRAKNGPITLKNFGLPQRDKIILCVKYFEVQASFPFFYEALTNVRAFFFFAFFHIY